MGDLVYRANKFVTKVHPGDVFVEIGSTKGAHGSTQYLSRLATSYGTVLHSVDIDDRTDIFQYINGAIRYQASGSVWARDVFPSLGYTIACLYLDNFDYDWDNPEFRSEGNKQKQWYKQFGIDMNNTNSQIEHLSQIISLEPYMGKSGVIICDDTFIYNGCWLGKCGAAVVYLLLHGWKIIEVEHNQGKSYGVALAKT